MPKITIEEPPPVLSQSTTNVEEILRLYDNGVRTAIGISKYINISTKKVSKILKRYRPEYIKYCLQLTGKEKTTTKSTHDTAEANYISLIEERILTVLTRTHLENYKKLIRQKK